MLSSVNAYNKKTIVFVFVLSFLTFYRLDRIRRTKQHSFCLPAICHLADPACWQVGFGTVCHKFCCIKDLVS